MTDLAATTPGDLDAAATRANTAHAAVIRSGQDMIDYAIECGQALLQAREQVARGMWLAWCESNLQMHITTAHRYMRIADHQDVILKQGIATIAGAMRVLADKPRRGHGPQRYTEGDIAEMRELAKEHSVKQVARMLGVSVGTVSKWAGPTRDHPAPARSPVARAPRVISGRMPITDEMIETVAEWLVARFGGRDMYPSEVVDVVRHDALDLLGRALAVTETRV